MRGRNHWWILWLAAALLVTSACTENNLDESDSDVVLEIISSTTPAITGEVELGTCSASGTPCLTSDNCPQDETCTLPPPGSSECTINEWSFSLANRPLSEGAIESPYNDVVLNRVDATYNWSDGATSTASIGLGGVTIPANGQAPVRFFPLGPDPAVFLFDNTTVDVHLVFLGGTIAGQSVAFAANAQLFIEDCQ